MARRPKGRNRRTFVLIHSVFLHLFQGVLPAFDVTFKIGSTTFAELLLGGVKESFRPIFYKLISFIVWLYNTLAYSIANDVRKGFLKLRKFRLWYDDEKFWLFVF